MPVKSKAEIVEQLTSSAERLVKVRTEAQKVKSQLNQIEPDVQPRATAAIIPTSITQR